MARSSSARPTTSHSRPDYRDEREKQRYEWMYQDRIRQQKKHAERQRRWEEHLEREQARKRHERDRRRHEHSRYDRRHHDDDDDDERYAAPQREDEAERRTIATVKFTAWKAEMERLFADRAGARGFPQPPFLGCREAACRDLVRDPAQPLKTCKHSFKQLVQLSGNLARDGFLKTLRRNVHPDRFAARKDLQPAAEECFKLVEELLQDPECE